MNECPMCGSTQTIYSCEDVGGEYEDELCDMYECLDCGGMFEMNCHKPVDDDPAIDKKAVLDFMSMAAFLRRLWGQS